MSRRDFIKTAAVATGCAAGLPITAKAAMPVVFDPPEDLASQLRADIYAMQDHVHKVKIVDACNFAPGMLITIAGANFMQNGTYRVCSVETDGATCEIV